MLLALKKNPVYETLKIGLHIASIRFFKTRFHYREALKY